MKTTKVQQQTIGRILKRADFLRIAGAGRKWVTPAFVVQVADAVARSAEQSPQKADAVVPRAQAHAGDETVGVRRRGAELSPQKTVICRVGLTITKKVFRHAVDRNRVRRRLRALALDVLALAPPALDIVLIARDGALKAPRDQLEKDLKWALRRLIGGEKPDKSGKNHAKSD